MTLLNQKEKEMSKFVVTTVDPVVHGGITRFVVDSKTVAGLVEKNGIAGIQFKDVWGAVKTVYVHEQFDDLADLIIFD